jgi:hypothetical protein
MVTIGLVISTYIVTLTLTESDGPWGIFVRLRMWSKLKVLSCFMCTAYWVAAIFALLYGVGIITDDILLLFIAWGGSVITYKLLQAALTRGV